MIDPAVLRAMLNAGCTADQIVAVAEEAARADEGKRAVKRAKDAERQRRRRSRHAESALSRVTERDIADDPSPKKETSPTPPKEKTTPSSSEDKSSSVTTPRAALETVLDAERAGAVIDHRKRIGKPLTVHAAKLIAGKFGRCADANEAADAMISNGWQGFEPEWLDKRPRPSPQAASPPRERTVSDALADIAAGKWPVHQDQTHEPDYIETSFVRRN